MDDHSNFIILYIPHPTKESALKTAEELVRQKLIACANIVDNITSVYRWENKINSDNEVILFGKTIQKNFKKIEELVTSIHPYEIPCIVSYQITSGNKPYLDWIKSEIS